MDKAIGIIFGLISALLGSIGFYQVIFQTNQNNSGGLVMGIIMWSLAIIMVWLGFNVKKLEVKTIKKTKEKLNQINGFSNNETVIDQMQIKVFHYTSLSLLHQQNYLTIGIELNKLFTDIEKRKLKIEFENEKIESKEYLIFRFNLGFGFYPKAFKTKLKNILKKIDSIKKVVNT